MAIVIKEINVTTTIDNSPLRDVRLNEQQFEFIKEEIHRRMKEELSKELKKRRER